MLTTARPTRKFRIFRLAASPVRQLSPHHTSSHPIHSLSCGAHRLPPIECRRCHMPPHSPSNDAARYFIHTCINPACVLTRPVCSVQRIRTGGLGYTSGRTCDVRGLSQRPYVSHHLCPVIKRFGPSAGVRLFESVGSLLAAVVNCARPEMYRLKFTGHWLRWQR